MFSQELLDIATRHQVYLERLKAGEVKKTDELFQRLNRELLSVLGAVRDANLSVLTNIEAARLIAAIREGQTAAYTEHLGKLDTMLRALASFEREFELESIDQVTIEDVEPRDDDDERALWAYITDTPMGATGKLLAAWMGAWLLNEVTRGSDLTRRAIAEGWSVSRLQTAFRGTKAQGYRDGLFGSSRRNGATTINTAIQHVSMAARVRTMRTARLVPKSPTTRLQLDTEGNVTSISRAAAAAAGGLGIKVGDSLGLMGYRWVSVLDNRTSQVCRSLDGQVFKFNAGPLPPAHANCRSSIIAEILGKWLRRDARGRFVGRPPRQAEGAEGDEQVGGSVTYYEWLKTQPAEFQDDALGPTRAKLFRDGGLSAETFAKLNLGRNFQPLTLEEMRRLKPNAFRRAGL